MNRFTARRARGLRVAAFAAAILSLVATGRAGGETLRVGKAVVNFGFLPLDVGMAAGIYKQNGIEIEQFDFTGGAGIVPLTKHILDTDSCVRS
jgi:ABC-type nitrate/sulfonate/bicarbonate transport system substrate-binding protein